MRLPPTPHRPISFWPAKKKDRRSPRDLDSPPSPFPPPPSEFACHSFLERQKGAQLEPQLHQKTHTAPSHRLFRPTTPCAHCEAGHPSQLSLPVPLLPLSPPHRPARRPRSPRFHTFLLVVPRVARPPRAAVACLDVASCPLIALAFILHGRLPFVTARRSHLGPDQDGVAPRRAAAPEQRHQRVSSSTSLLISLNLTHFGCCARARRIFAFTLPRRARWTTSTFLLLFSFPTRLLPLPDFVTTITHLALLLFVDTRRLSLPHRSQALRLR